MLFSISKELREDAGILVVRNDGLGDLILTLPLIASLKMQKPKAHVALLVRKAFSSFASLCKDVDEIIVDEGILLKRDQKFGAKEKAQKRASLLRSLREKKFDVALLPYAEKESAKIVQKAKIPVRVGSYRRSFFFRFTLFFTASRKSSTLSEYELNLAYLPILRLSAKYVHPSVSLKGPAKRKNQIVLHPYKRNDTSLSWPLPNFVQLSLALIAKGYRVVIMGDLADEEVLRSYFTPDKNLILDTKRDLKQLGELLLESSLFIGNSSGPLHYAALLGLPHIGFFPPANSVSSKRWKTLPIEGYDPEKYLLEPEQFCNRNLCVSGCVYYNCLQTISVERALSAVDYWLSKN